MLFIFSFCWRFQLVTSCSHRRSFSTRMSGRSLTEANWHDPQSSNGLQVGRISCLSWKYSKELVAPQLKFAEDVRKGGCPDQARWSIPVPWMQRFHLSCKGSRFLDWPAGTRTSTVMLSCSKKHRRFDQPHYPPKQIFVSDKMAEQPELISDNLLEKVLLCDQCIESDAKENCLHSRITQEELDSSFRLISSTEIRQECVL